MSEPLVVSDAPAVEAALTDPALVPHGTDDPSNGATIRLRHQMARFSGPVDHPERRRAVEAAIARLDIDSAGTMAEALTRAAAAAGASVDEVARTVPTLVMGRLLGIVDAGLVDRVDAMVRVIGRGEPAGDASDAAVDSLLAAVADSNHAGDPVALVSMLYQNFDATTALIRATVEGRQLGRPAAPAVPRTRRVATAECSFSGHDLAPGDEVVVEIGAAKLPFGFGPHECPGRRLAEQIVESVVSAVADSTI